MRTQVVVPKNPHMWVGDDHADNLEPVIEIEHMEVFLPDRGVARRLRDMLTEYLDGAE